MFLLFKTKILLLNVPSAYHRSDLKQQEAVKKDAATNRTLLFKWNRGCLNFNSLAAVCVVSRAINPPRKVLRIISSKVHFSIACMFHAA